MHVQQHVLCIPCCAVHFYIYFYIYFSYLGLKTIWWIDYISLFHRWENWGLAESLTESDLPTVTQLMASEPGQNPAPLTHRFVPSSWPHTASEDILTDPWLPRDTQGSQRDFWNQLAYFSLWAVENTLCPLPLYLSLPNAYFVFICSNPEN